MSLNNNYAIGQGSNEVMHVLHPSLKYPELWRGCVGAWAPCLGPGGLRLQDNSGYGNHGTLTNMDPATDWVTTDGVGALDFDGSNDLASLQNSSLFSLPRFSLVFSFRAGSAWSAVSNYGLFSKRTSFGVNDEWNLLYRGDSNESNWIGNQGFVFRVNSSSGLSGVVAATVAGAFNHIVATHQSGVNTSIYHNGVLGGKTGVVASLAGTSVSPVIGCFNSSSLHAPIQVFEAAFYNRVLTQSEISLLARRRGIAYETTTRRSAYNSPAPPPAGRYSLFDPRILEVA